jgi:diguanylate cyclase (GGDEF)-like protein/PAS domain S-box-containing protein
MLESLKNFFTSELFIPHGHCNLWQSHLVGLHVGSDLLIGLAYYSIPIMLIYFVHKRRDVPFPWLLLMFGAFIIACGTTHLVAIWTLWHPNYWLSGGLKLTTAFISLCTAVGLFTSIPKALARPSTVQLVATNQKLAQELGDRILTEAALKQSETRFRLIFEDAAIGIVLSDAAGVLMATNPAFQKMLGYDQLELSGMHFTQFTHPESLPLEETLFQEMVAGIRDFYHLEKRYISKEGQLLWGHLTVSLVRDDKDNPQFCIAMVQNITERKKAESDLRHYQEHLEELVGERTAELTEVNKQLCWQATHDALTGLVNRSEFERCLEKAVNSAWASQQECTLCYLDLDRFKIVNDTCGHLAGDELLRQVSTLLQNQCRKTDTVARLGGDEFGLLLYQCSLEQSLRVVQTLQASIQEFRFVWQDQTFTIGVSIGLVAIDTCSLNPEQLLDAADTACYTAKNRGRNRVHVYQLDDQELQEQRREVQWAARLTRAMSLTLPVGEQESQRRTDMTRLLSPSGVSDRVMLEEQENSDHVSDSVQAAFEEQAVAKLGTSAWQTLTIQDQLCLYYQPIVPLYEAQDESPQLAISEHYEVLLRLIDETGEVIPPMTFLPAAKRYNLMPSIDRWVIQTFFAWLKHKYSAGLDEGRGNGETSSQPQVPSRALYTINLSCESLKDDQFVDFLKAQFRNYQIPPQVICFEITETAVVANLTKTTQLIGEFKALGCHFALDDFGSGMTSFAYLKYLSVDYLKINGDFVKDVVINPIDCAMVEAIHSIGRIIGIQTVAEFVADELILEKVKALGVDYAQGYAIAKPKPLWH